MSETWRQMLQQLGPVPGEAEALAGDIDLLVPIEPGWRALDLTGGAGARAAVLAHRCREVVAATRDPALLPVLEARALEHAAGRITPYLATDALPAGPFDLVALEGEGPWTLEQLRALQPNGGWLIWLMEGAGVPPVSRNLKQASDTVRSILEWGRERIQAPERWRRRLDEAGYELSRTYVHAREYIWGYLPFDAYRAQRYYLENLQEEAIGAGRGKARVARATGKAGVYPYLVSAYVVVARAVPQSAPSSTATGTDGRGDAS